MGGHSTNPFGLRKDIIKVGGYKQFFQAILLPLYNRGLELFLLHRPFGEAVKSDKFMDFSSTYYLANSEYNYVIDDFHEAMEWAKIHMPNAEFISYLGTHGYDLIAHLEKNEIDEHLTKMFDAVSPLLKYSNMHIAIDQMDGLENTHPMALFVQTLNSYLIRAGRTLFIEPAPKIDDPNKAWTAEIPSISSTGLSTRREKDPARRQSKISGVVHAEWLNSGDRNWENLVIPNTWKWLGEMLQRGNMIPIVWENMLGDIQNMSATQIIKKALESQVIVNPIYDPTT